MCSMEYDFIGLEVGVRRFGRGPLLKLVSGTGATFFGFALGIQKF